MRIVHVANFYGPRSGGLRTAMHELGRGYERAGHEFVMIVPGRRGKVERTPFGARIVLPGVPLAGTGYRVIPAETRVRSVLAELEPDRIEVSDRLTLRRLGLWARRQGIPAVMFSHEKLTDWLRQMAGNALGQDNSRAARIADRLNAASLGNFDRVVCTTEYAAEEFDRIVPGSAIRIPLGVDLEQFNPLHFSPVVRDRYLGGGELLLAHVGRLSPEKAPHRSIHALSALRAAGVDARLVVAGDGPLRGRLQRSARNLPVLFTGFVTDRNELAALLASADVALNPGPIETFCLAALEALASGTPVVAARSSALPELLVEGAGEVSGPSGEEFAEAVQRIAARSVESRRHAARARAAAFPWSKTVRSMLELHESHEPAGSTPDGARDR